MCSADHPRARCRAAGSVDEEVRGHHPTRRATRALLENTPATEGFRADDT